MTFQNDTSSDTDETSGAIVKELSIVNERGLHARASAKFVKCANEFDAIVTVGREDQTVLATSIMGLMMLAASIGTQIKVEARGEQAREAIDALTKLVADKFGEDN